MTKSALSHLRIVLVEPAGPLNVGAVARVMKNMGLSQLVLVNPHCQITDPDALQMAVHAKDVLAAAQQVTTLPEALVGCQRAIATTSRDRHTLELTLEHPRSVLPWLLDTSDQRGRSPASALIFGPEDRGLSNAELNYAQRFLKIPTSDLYPALNLAQAVAICCYELYQLALHELNPSVDAAYQAPLMPLPEEPEAPLNELDQAYQHLERMLLRIGYLYPHTAESRMQKFRRLFNRTSLSESELAMLRGILRQMEWALNTSHQALPPDDSD